MNRRLTGKQLAFVTHYVSAEVNMNATEAAKRAGYNGSYESMRVIASQNLTKSNIRTEIDRRLEQAFHDAGADITVEATLRRLSTLGHKSEQAGQYASAVKCAELQGKYLKMFTDRIDSVQAIEEYTTDQLIELLREVMKAGDIDLVRILSDLSSDAAQSH